MPLRRCAEKGSDLGEGRLVAREDLTFLFEEPRLGTEGLGDEQESTLSTLPTVPLETKLYDPVVISNHEISFVRK